MSVALVRVKDPGKSDEEYSGEEIPISLPVVLGRGSLLKCGEKGISRRHAYLDWDDDGVLVTAVHQNPTFVVVNGREEELTVGSSALLTHADTFGLMKTRFWYKISMPDAAPEDKDKTKEDLHILDTTATEQVELTEKTENNSEVKLVIKNVENGGKETKVKDVSRDSVQNVEVQDTSPGQDNKQSTLQEAHHAEQYASVKGEKTLTKNDCTDNHNCYGDSVEPTTVTLQEVQSAVSTRKRDLPAWMAKIDVTIDRGKQIEKGNLHAHGAAQKTHSSTSKRKTAVKNVKNNDSFPAFQANQNTGDKQEVSGSSPALRGSDAVVGGAQGPRKKQNKANNCSPTRNRQESTTRKATSLPKKVSSPQKHRTKIHHDISDDNSDEQETETNAQERDESNTTSPNKKKQMPVKDHLSPSKQHVVSENEEDIIHEASNSRDSVSRGVPLPTTATGTSPALSQRKVPRGTCQYGATCYRKNPKHRADFAHYGDSDYNENPSDSEDSDDDRPQCEFGVDCYRKNPQHRRDFRHSRVPQPQRKAKRKARRQKQAAESGSDEYDYEDPFLNDGSSDDYAPTESGSDSPVDADDADVEDTNRMLKEAKKFVKKN